jgi:predicted nucleic acid-binding protein
MMRITIDSDVLTYAFIAPTKEVYKERYNEVWKLHEKADAIYKDVIKGVHELIIQSTVLIETAIVISRATMDRREGASVSEKIKRDASEVLYLDGKFTEYCVERGVKILLSGFDTVVFSCADLTKSALLTNDQKFYNNISKHHPDMNVYKYPREDHPF